jgi:mRNA interferase MazF
LLLAVSQIKRGDVYFANLDPVVGSETGKTRPVLVVQNDIGNQYSPTIIVAIITDFSQKKASYPICVAIGEKQGLKKPSVVNLAQVRTIDKKRLIFPKIASLSDDIMTQVDRALMNSLGLR